MTLAFKDTVLTNKGFNISNKAALGKTQFSIVKAVSTDSDLTGYKIEDLKNLTSLPNEIDSGTLTDYDAPENSISVIKLNFDNSKFKQGYTVRAIGLYGQDSDNNLFLHSLTVSDTPIVIPEVTGNIFDGLNHSITIFSGDNKKMNVDLEQQGAASIHYVDQSISNITGQIKDEIQLSLNKKAEQSDLNETKMTLKTDIDSKQPLGNYASPSDVSGAKQDAIIHSDNNKDNLQEQINGKQQIGDYVTNEDLKDKLNQKQDKGLPSGIHLNLSFLNNITNDSYNDLQYSIDVDSTNGSTITGYTIYLSNDGGYSTNVYNNNNVGYIPDDVKKDNVCSIYATVHSTNGDVNSETQKILIPSNLDNYLDFVIKSNNDMTNSYNANIINNNFQYFISKNIKLYVIQTENSMNSIPDDYIKQTHVLPFQYQTYISNYKSKISDVVIRQLNAKSSTYMNTSSGYYLNGHNGWKIVMYAELLDSYGNETNIFSKAKLY